MKPSPRISIERDYHAREIVISVSIPENEWYTLISEAIPSEIDRLNLLRLCETRPSNILLALFLFFLKFDKRDGDKMRRQWPNPFPPLQVEQLQIKNYDE